MPLWIRIASPRSGICAVDDIFARVFAFRTATGQAPVCARDANFVVVGRYLQGLVMSADPHDNYKLLKKERGDDFEGKYKKQEGINHTGNFNFNADDPNVLSLCVAYPQMRASR